MSATAYSWIMGPIAQQPEAYWSEDGVLHDWNTGQQLPWRETRMLVRLEWVGLDYWTWVDPESGRRTWEIRG
jgi:hypothetical protein